MNKLPFLLFFAFLFWSCHSDISKKNDFGLFGIVDSQASPETQALLINLHKIGPGKIIIGQQDATAYGIDWRNEDLRSDINDLTGRFPALYGWNLGYLENSYNLDSVDFERMKFWIKSAFERGGINTITMWLKNPVTSGICSDTSMVVKHILPGGTYNAKFKNQLRSIGSFLSDLKTKKGVQVPVILRMYHKSNSPEYWWGVHSCSDEDYKKIFQYTVKFLKDTCEIHNVLYAYSTDVFENKEEFLSRYPGNEYVDIIGFDNYKYYKPPYNIKKSVNLMQVIVRIADENNKIAAITETGLNGLRNDSWFTQKLLEPIKNDSIASKITYIMLGPNTDKKHHCVPYLGHAAAKNFIQFENDPFTIFEEDLPAMYQIQIIN